MKFKDPRTDRIFTAILIKEGYLVPLWVKTPPENWIPLPKTSN